MTGDLLGSALCKEEDELRQNVEEWNQAALKLEMLMNELVKLFTFRDKSIKYAEKSEHCFASEASVVIW